MAWVFPLFFTAFTALANHSVLYDLWWRFDFPPFWTSGGLSKICEFSKWLSKRGLRRSALVLGLQKKKGQSIADQPWILKLPGNHVGKLPKISAKQKYRKRQKLSTCWQPCWQLAAYHYSPIWFSWTNLESSLWKMEPTKKRKGFWIKLLFWNTVILTK